MFRKFEVASHGNSECGKYVPPCIGWVKAVWNKLWKIHQQSRAMQRQVLSSHCPWLVDISREGLLMRCDVQWEGRNWRHAPRSRLEYADEFARRNHRKDRAESSVNKNCGDPCSTWWTERKNCRASEVAKYTVWRVIRVRGWGSVSLPSSSTTYWRRD